MSSDKRNTRRRFLQLTGAATALGLAGCTGGGGGGDGNGGEDTTTSEGGSEDTTSEGGSGDTTTSSSTTTGGDGGGGGDVPSEVTNYLSDVSNFDGSVADMTGESDVTIDVGASGNGGNFAFGPAAVRVDAGTTVTWEWNGKGGSHNVVAESGGDFESELVGESGHTFEQTFDSEGTVTYYCTPHKSLGMKGAVIVG